ncbi:MAG: 1,4-dihydroxy-2-naphthoate polyprenyltransferase [Acidobacteriota bacterium]
MSAPTSPSTTARPSPFAMWLAAARPKTLPAAAVPVVVGSAIAWSLGGFRLLPAIAALVGGLLIQIATNFANDVFDFQKGADNEERTGPTRAVAAGWITPRTMFVAMWFTFGLAFLIGLYLASVSGWAILIVGLISILAGIAYTGGPYPLGYNGLGDVAVMIFFGFVAVCGTVWVQMLEIPALAWWLSVPVGALSTAILVVNNVRDRITDTAAGKRTLVVRFGRGVGVVEYVLLFVASYAVVVLVAVQSASPWLALPLLTLPGAMVLVRRVTTLEGQALNPVLAQTAMLLLGFGTLLSMGLIVG